MRFFLKFWKLTTRFLIVFSRKVRTQATSSFFQQELQHILNPFLPELKAPATYSQSTTPRSQLQDRGTLRGTQNTLPILRFGALPIAITKKIQRSCPVLWLCGQWGVVGNDCQPHAIVRSATISTRLPLPLASKYAPRGGNPEWQT